MRLSINAFDLQEISYAPVGRGVSNQSMLLSMIPSRIRLVKVDAFCLT